MKKIFLLGTFLFLIFSFAQAQRTITGTVKDQSGEPMIGANVVATGSTTGTTVDLDGNFTLNVQDGMNSLTVTYTGFEDQVVDITSTNNVAVVLVEGVTLTEVVKLAYGASSKAESVASAVTTIKSGDIEDTSNGSFVQALQARAPGLNISTGNGGPGANSLVLIRGVGSISGNIEPLFVIDGVPVDEDNFRSLNPADIESATVLKDASASGLYGNRAAGGVILITTKRGQYKQPLKVSYTLQYGNTDLQTPQFDVMNSQQILELERASNRGFGAGVGVPAYWEETLGITNGVPLSDADIARLAQTNTKWNDVSIRTGITRSHNLNFSSGGENSTVFASLGYFNQDGISKRSALERYNLRTNFDTKTDKFRLGVSLTANYSNSRAPEGIDAGNLANPFLSAYLAKPYMDPYNEDGSLNSIGDNTAGFTNVPYLTLNSALNNVDDEKEIKAIGNINLEYDIIEGLTAGVSYGLDMNDVQQFFYTSPLSLRGQTVPTPISLEKGTHFEQSIRDVRQSFLTKLVYQKQIDKHYIQASAFTEYLKSEIRSFGFQAFGINPRFIGFGAGFIDGTTTEDADGDGIIEQHTYVPNVFQNLSELAQFSTFGILKYDYNSIYGLEVSLRRDGSSRFADNFKYGTFWSVAGRWNISEESFFNVDAVNNLKLRASYGTTGQDRIDGGYYLGLTRIFDLFGVGSGYENNQTLAPSQLGNADLRWETTTEFNVGLDFVLLNNRLSGNLDIYNRVTSDLFIPNPNTLISGGFRDISANVGEMKNSGVELFLSYDVFTGRKSDFSWNVFFNGSYNQNEITSLPGVEANDEGQIILNRDQRSPEAVGQPFNSFFVVRWAGVNPANGAPLYYTKEGEVTENFRDEDRVFVGKSSTPVWQGGFGTGLGYKGISLDVQFSFVADVWRNNGSFGVLEDPTLIGIANQSTTMLDYWQEPGDITAIPGLGTGSVRNLLTDRYIEDASYLRLRNIKLGYKLTKETLNVLPVRSVDFFIQAENYLTFSKWRGFDPEFQTIANSDFFSFPNPKILTFGAGINF